MFINIYEPELKPEPKVVGLLSSDTKTSKISFPWEALTHVFGGPDKILKLKNWRELIICILVVTQFLGRI